MGRGFLASPSSRDFKRSPNRNRIVRGATAEESDFYFTAGERAGDTALGGGLFTFFPFPTYGSTAPIFQAENAATMPLDTLLASLQTPYVVGDVFRVGLHVEGISSFYNPDEAPVVDETSFTLPGQPPIPVTVIRRPHIVGLTIGDFRFKAVPDQVTSLPYYPQGASGPVTPLVSGELLCLNRTSSAVGDGSIVHWRRHIQATMMATVNRPFPPASSGQARSQFRPTRIAFDLRGFPPSATEQARAAMRNTGSLNAASEIVQGLNIIHTPAQEPPIPTVQPSASMCIGVITSWQKTSLTEVEDATYTDL